MENSTRQLRQVALLALGLLLAGYVACSPPVYADDLPVLPEGTVSQLPRDGARITHKRTCFCYSRTMVDNSNTAAAMERKLTASLMTCSGALAERSKPEPGWRVALKWTAIGLAVGAAFTAGALL